MNKKTFMLLATMILAVAQSNAQTSPHGTINIACEKCHTTDSWKMRADPSFDHATTGFVLEGKHKATSCVGCHKNLVFTRQAQQCSSCHVDVHKAELGANCTRCHSLQSWKITDMIQRHQSTRFPLIGRHASLDCVDCHSGASGNQYRSTPTTCYGCHKTDFDNSKNPNHTFAGFSTDCSKCHRVNASQWSGGFDHNLTGFPLIGAHQSVACISCHKTQIFKNTAQECYACHQSDYQSTTTPNHALAKLSTACQTCHTTLVWKPSTFSHNNTKFPLTGSHRSVQCVDCHTNGQFAGLSSACFTCHQSDYNKTTSPNHVTGLLNHQCESCHTTTAWQPSTFSHTATKFPLTGKHLATPCEACHTNGNYQLVYTNCTQCHTADFQGASNPNHVAGNFSQNCATCHSTAAWRPASFDHNTTKFALTGAHVSVPCQTCHLNNNYQLVYTNCYQCHATDFQGATNPNHAAGNFSQNCATCHSTTAWQPATFDHGTTKFALTGAHVATPCVSCHTNNNYQLVYTNCYQCHASDFQGATNPNHVAGNFSQVCQTCHSTTAWQPATFDHSTTKFPLTGIHITTACQSCHTSGNYTLTYSGCYACHTTEYNNTTNPNHRTSGYPTTCETCHTTTNWTSATFNHTWFPTSHGNARGVCVTCHTNPANYKVFQCTTCHTQAQTDPKHSRVSGYVFNSQNCYTCHPKGNN